MWEDLPLEEYIFLSNETGAGFSSITIKKQ